MSEVISSNRNRRRSRKAEREKSPSVTHTKMLGELSVAHTTQNAGMIDIHISRGDSGYVSAEYTPGEIRSSGSIYITYITVKKEGTGLGTKLMQGLLHEAHELGADDVYGEILHPGALAIRAKVFGRDNLTFFDPRAGTDNLEIDYQTALFELANNGTKIWASSDPRIAPVPDLSA